METKISQAIDSLRFWMAGAIVMLHCFDPKYHVGGGNFSGLDICGIVNVLFSQGICRTAVPAFFLISGYLFFSQLKQWNHGIWIGKIKKRIKTLLVPYLIWNIIAFGVYYLVQCVKLKGIESLVACFQSKGGFHIFWDSNSGWMPMDFPLWFIRDLMAVALFSPFIYLLIKNKVGGLVSIVIAIIIHLLCIWPITNGLSSAAILFFMMGAYLRLHGCDLLNVFKPVEILSYVLTTVLLIAVVYCWGRYRINPYLHHSLQLFGTFATLTIASRLCDSKIGKIGICYSKTSFWIFAIQSIYVIDVSKFAVSILIQGDSHFIGIVHYFVSAAVALIICLVSYFIFNKLTPAVTKILCGSR